MSRSKRNRVGGALHPRGNYAKARAASLDGMYYHLLAELALNRFSWRGLPPTVDERWIEMCLCEYGCALFFEDKRIGRFLVTQAGYQGRLNVYNNPTRFEPVGVNYHYRQLKAGRECIPIWDNRMRMSFKDVLWQYARRLADIDKAYDVNLESLKLPTIITADPRTKLTVQNMLQQRQDGQDYIIGYDSLGIQSSGTEKKERLISDEVAQANEKTDVFRLSFLKARQAAATEINRLWPQLNVWVEYADAQSSGVPNALDSSASGTTDIDMPASYDAGIGGVL